MNQLSKLSESTNGFSGLTLFRLLRTQSATKETDGFLFVGMN